MFIHTFVLNEPFHIHFIQVYLNTGIIILRSDCPCFAANAAALEKVQPEWIEASDIDVKIGTTWIEPLDYEQFI